MNPAIKNFFLISAKNAVNALLLNTALWAKFPGVFNLNSKAGLWNFGYGILICIGSREVAVWGPVLLQWSSTSANPAAIQLPATPPAVRSGIYVAPKTK